jgi:hypothetical protein
MAAISSLQLVHLPAVLLVQCSYKLDQVVHLAARQSYMLALGNAAVKYWLPQGMVCRLEVA